MKNLNPINRIIVFLFISIFIGTIFANMFSGIFDNILNSIETAVFAVTTTFISGIIISYFTQGKTKTYLYDMIGYLIGCQTGWFALFV